MTSATTTAVVVTSQWPVPFALSTRERVFDLKAAESVFAHAVSPYANIGIHAMPYPRWALTRGVMPDYLQVPCDCIDTGRQRGVLIVLYDAGRYEALVWGFVHADYLARESSRFLELRNTQEAAAVADAKAQATAATAGSARFATLEAAQAAYDTAAAVFAGAPTDDMDNLVRLAHIRTAAKEALDAALLQEDERQTAAVALERKASRGSRFGAGGRSASDGDNDPFRVSVKQAYSTIPAWVTALKCERLSVEVKWADFDWYLTPPHSELDIPYLERCVKSRLAIYRFIRTQRPKAEKTKHPMLHLALAALVTTGESALSSDDSAMLFLQGKLAVQRDSVAFHFIREMCIFPRNMQTATYQQLLDDIRGFERAIAQIRMDVLFDYVLADAAKARVDRKNQPLLGAPKQCALLQEVEIQTYELGPVFPGRREPFTEGKHASAVFLNKCDLHFAAYSTVYSCDMEYAPGAWQRRDGALWQGTVYFPTHGMRSVVLSASEALLRQSLVVAQQETALQHFTRRHTHLASFIASNVQWLLSASGSALAADELAKVTANDIDSMLLGVGVPPCMRALQLRDHFKFNHRQQYFRFFLQSGGSIQRLESSLQPRFTRHYTKKFRSSDKAKSEWKGVYSAMKSEAVKGAKKPPSICRVIIDIPGTLQLCPFAGSNKPSAACAAKHGIPQSLVHSGPVGFLLAKRTLAAAEQKEKAAKLAAQENDNKRAAEAKRAIARAKPKPGATAVVAPDTRVLVAVPAPAEIGASAKEQIERNRVMAKARLQARQDEYKRRMAPLTIVKTEHSSATDAVHSLLFGDADAAIKDPSLLRPVSPPPVCDGDGDTVMKQRS